MQFKSILLLAASATLAIASGDKYIVGNCGDPSGTSPATKEACKTVKGKYCGEITHMTRCVVEEAKWEDFETACTDEEDTVFSRPGSWSLQDAETMALC